MNKRPMIPYFLQQLDDKLLKNKPGTWAARTHLVVWYAFLFAALLSAVCFLIFFDAKQYSNTPGWIIFVSLIAFIGFVFWLIFLLRFNPFKRYGNWFLWDGLKSFALYFIAIASMVAVCFIPSAVETYRANQQFGNNEIVNDINELNSTACKLEHHLLPLDWRADTCKVVDTIINYPSPADNYDEEVTMVININEYRRIDTAELRSKLVTEDSVVKINDSMYVFFKSPDYVFVHSYNAADYATQNILSSAEIYRTVIRPYKKPDRSALVKRMEELKAKYAVESPYSNYEEYDVENINDGYEKKISKKYGLYRISNGIDNAVQKKYAWSEDWKIYLRVFYYTVMVLSLLVFIFRHSTVKTFFLSILTAVVLMIITGLMIAITNGNETSALSSIILYYILVAAISFSISDAKVRRAIQGISLNLFLFFTPFIPLVIVGLNEASRYRRYDLTEYKTHDTELYVLIAEIAGALIFLVLLEPVFRKLYRKWYAAPEN